MEGVGENSAGRARGRGRGRPRTVVVDDEVDQTSGQLEHLRMYELVVRFHELAFTPCWVCHCMLALGHYATQVMYSLYSNLRAAFHLGHILLRKQPFVCIHILFILHLWVVSMTAIGYVLATFLFGCLAKTMTLRNNPSYDNKYNQNVENHGVDKELMERVKHLMNLHYKNNMKDEFESSEMTKRLESNGFIKEKDWESTFFIKHRPSSNIHELTGLSIDLSKTMEEYIDQLIKLAEKLSELMCENLGIEKNHIMKAFSGSQGPSVGTKAAIYPQCPRPELIRGLREHTDAGGIILLLQDDQVPGLEFFKDGKWVTIPPSKQNKIFVNIGDQIEILSNGVYKSVTHRVMAMKDGNRLSIATFYNPAGDAIISPAPKLLLPNHICFQDYLNLYMKTKFGDKGLRFQSLKDLVNGH